MKNGLIIYANGIKIWYKNDLYHRENLPAIIYPGGDTSWYYEGVLHRINGPAVDWKGHQLWYYQGNFIKCISQQEFERLIKLRLLW